jgi:ATP-binding cassette subfamily B multidrug efflux pump
LFRSLALLRLFEKLLHPYPDAEPPAPPSGFFSFMWACTEGLRGYILALSLLSALVSGFEAWLFSMMGRVVDWAASTHSSCWPAWWPSRWNRW